MYFDSNEDNSGPGEYHVNFKPTLPAPPQYTMGMNTAIWFDYDKPGPGRYNVRQDYNTSPKYTMAQHLKPIISTHVPGPGTYSPSLKHTHLQEPAYTMQGPTKYDLFRMIPGVGSYNVGGELGGIAYTMGQRFLHKPSLSPGPGLYSPESPTSAPAYSIGRQFAEYPFLTPGPGAYNVGGRGNAAPAFTMGQRFVRLKDKLNLGKDKRFHAALKQRPPHRSAGNTPASSHAGSRAKVLGGDQPWTRPASPPLMIAPPSTRPRLSWTRPSTWDITAPLVPNPRPRPMTSAENIQRRIHFRVGPTQNAQFNEYIREMYRYMGNKGVRYGRVAKWGTSKSFIKATCCNAAFIGKGER